MKYMTDHTYSMYELLSCKYIYKCGKLICLKSMH